MFIIVFVSDLISTATDKTNQLHGGLEKEKLEKNNFNNYKFL